MDATLKNISILSVLVIIAIIVAVIFGYGEYRHLLGRKAERLSLKTQNSQKGLELFNQINLLKRLADNDLKLIEHIARTELGLVREDELVFVYGPAEVSEIPDNKASGFTPAFRFLTEEEFDVLLKFDLKSFDFYEELSEFEK
jgi:cell division protein FtsB